MGSLLAEITLSLFLHVVCSARADDFRPCNFTDLHPCPGDDQTCQESTGRCVCVSGFVISGGSCVRPEPSSGGHAAVAAVVIIFVTALLAAGALLIVRKYKLVEYARRRLQERRNRDVIYEDVMIGQDDPPLTP